MGSVTWRKRGHRYQVSWRLDDGSQGAKTVDTPDEARDLADEKRVVPAAPLARNGAPQRPTDLGRFICHNDHSPSREE
jgi:hypothetical protein